MIEKVELKLFHLKIHLKLCFVIFFIIFTWKSSSFFCIIIIIATVLHTVIQSGFSLFCKFFYSFLHEFFFLFWIFWIKNWYFGILFLFHFISFTIFGFMVIIFFIIKVGLLFLQLLSCIFIDLNIFSTPFSSIHTLYSSIFLLLFQLFLDISR